MSTHKSVPIYLHQSILDGTLDLFHEVATLGLLVHLSLAQVLHFHLQVADGLQNVPLDAVAELLFGGLLGAGQFFRLSYFLFQSLHYAFVFPFQEGQVGVESGLEFLVVGSLVGLVAPADEDLVEHLVIVVGGADCFVLCNRYTYTIPVGRTSSCASTVSGWRTRSSSSAYPAFRPPSGRFSLPSGCTAGPCTPGRP